MGPGGPKPGFVGGGKWGKVAPQRPLSTPLRPRGRRSHHAHCERHPTHLTVLTRRSVVALHSVATLSHVSPSHPVCVLCTQHLRMYGCLTRLHPCHCRELTLALRSRRLNMSPCPTITSTRGGRDKVCLAHAPHTLARSAIPNILGVARARDSNLSAPPPCFSILLSSGFPAPVSRAPTPPTCLSARLVARETFGFRPLARASGAVVGVGVFDSRQRRP